MTATMAKKKTKADAKTETDPVIDAAADRHRHRLIGLRLPASVRAVVKKLADKERRSVSQMCAILIEDGLRGRDLWPDGGD
jgi:hypothetical protein